MSKYGHKTLWLVFKISKYCHKTSWLEFVLKIPYEQKIPRTLIKYDKNPELGGDMRKKIEKSPKPKREYDKNPELGGNLKKFKNHEPNI